jgi:dienelactone hydrolase
MAIVTREISYQHEDLPLTGVLYRDDTVAAPAAGLLIIPGAGGLDDHVAGQGARYAGLGYAVFTADMFGPGVTGNRDRTMSVIKELRADPDRLVARAVAGLAELQAAPEAAGRYAALGFCFGGQTVITLARAGVQLAGVVSMHGALSTTRRAAPNSVRVPVLVCHGADDPHVPIGDVVSFVEEMTTAGADWQLIAYGGAVHGFTHTHAVPGANGVAYHEPTDRRSFAAATAFLTEVLGDGRDSDG